MKKYGGRSFDQTRWSLVLRAGGPSTVESRAALAELCRIYRGPLLTYALRYVNDPARAEDFVQDFFMRLIERDLVAIADPALGRFRSFLQTSFKHHILNALETEQAQKRGGGAAFVDVNLVDVKGDDVSPELLYDRQWAWELVGRVLTRLREEQERRGQGAVFEALYERLVGDDDGNTLRKEAERLGIDCVTIRVRLMRLRKLFGDLLRDEVAQTVSRSEDIDDEIQVLLAALRGNS
jgi:RNA polymerase sigma factor (sigma-70 family)